MRMGSRIFYFGWFIVIGVAGFASWLVQPVWSETRDYASFLRELIDLDRLPLLEEGVRTMQASSYDRASRYDPSTDTYMGWDANNDSGQYIRIDPKTGEGVMAEIKGPGCIYRIWSANPQGKIRFYFDGARRPLEFGFNDLFRGDHAPFVKPLVWQRLIDFGPNDNPPGCSYLPLPFKKSCKVTSDKPHNQFYHIGYKTFPPGTSVPTFRLPLSAEEQHALDEVVSVWNRKGENPQPKSTAQSFKNVVELAPHQEVTLAQIDGPATIQQLHVKLDSQEKFAGRKVLLKIFWDGSQQPGVEVPLADFFCAGLGWKPFQSLPIGFTADGGYCYWRMPFRKSARVVATNEGQQSSKVSLRLNYLPGAVPENSGIFHAKWRRERACAKFDYPILETTGQGKFVGVTLSVDNIHGGWWGDGDEKAWVDGENFPSTFGTSTDGYFGDGNGLHDFGNALHGCQDFGRAQSAYRWQMTDSISFVKSFRFTIENYQWLSPVKNDYASVAYWYSNSGGSGHRGAMGTGRDFFQPTPVADRLPRPPHIENDIQEVEWIVPPGLPIVEDEALSEGKGIALSGQRNKELTLTVTAPADDRYALELGVGPKTDHADFVLLQEDRPVTDRVLLHTGKNNLVVRLNRSVPSDAPVILDYVRIGLWRNFVRDWMVIGPFDNTEDKKFDEVYPPGKELVFDKTYEGENGLPVKWKTARADMDGFLNFNDCFPEMHNETIAYALTTIISPRDNFTEILVGSDDGVKVWLNGKLVHDNHAHRGASPDQDTVRVRLNPGPNTLLVKVDQGSGGWGFYLRLIDPKDQLQFALPTQLKQQLTPATPN